MESLLLVLAAATGLAPAPPWCAPAHAVDLERRPPPVFSRAAGPGFSLAVDDVTATDSPLSGDRVLHFTARAGKLRLVRLRAVHKPAGAGPYPFAGGVDTGAGRGPGLPAIAVHGLVDLVDGAGRPVALDRAVVIAVRPGWATVTLPATGWDGRPEPGPALHLRFHGVVLGGARPAGPPAVVEPGRGPAGGALHVAARDLDPWPDRLDTFRVELDRPGGAGLVVRGLALDRGRPDGGVRAEGGRLAVTGRADVLDRAGRLVRAGARMSMWVTPDGVAHVVAAGLFRAEFRGGGSR